MARMDVPIAVEGGSVTAYEARSAVKESELTQADDQAFGPAMQGHGTYGDFTMKAR